MGSQETRRIGPSRRTTLLLLLLLDESERIATFTPQGREEETHLRIDDATPELRRYVGQDRPGGKEGVLLRRPRFRRLYPLLLVHLVLLPNGRGSRRGGGRDGEGYDGIRIDIGTPRTQEPLLSSLRRVRPDLIPIRASGPIVVGASRRRSLLIVFVRVDARGIARILRFVREEMLRPSDETSQDGIP